MDHSFSGEVVFNGRRYRFVRPALRRRDPDADVYRNSNGQRVRYQYILPAPKRPRLATSAEDIQRLLREVREGDDDVAAQTECAVCLQDYAAGEALSAMPVCSHAFHHGCITEWLGRNAVCPLCRRKLQPDDQEEEEEEVQVPEDEDEVDENGVRRSWNWRRVPLTAADYTWGTWSSAAGEFHHRID